MQRATNGSVALAYERAGPSTAGSEAVVFIAGLGYGQWMWRWQQAALEDEYPTLVWNNRGTALSDTPEGPYTIADMAADLEAVLSDAGIERAHLVGASMGGMIAQHYALEYDRAKTLSLLCATPGGANAKPVPDSTKQALGSIPDDIDPREEIKRRMAPAVSGTFFEDDPDRLESIIDWRLEQDADATGRMAQAQGVIAFDVADRLEEIELPVLVLHGEADEVVPVENGRLLAAGLPNATLETCPEGHHLFFIEEAPWVNDRLRRFLEDHVTAPTSATSTESDT